MESHIDLLHNMGDDYFRHYSEHESKVACLGEFLGLYRPN